MTEYVDDDEYEETEPSTSGELAEIHSTLEQILSTLQDRAGSSSWVWVVLVILLFNGWSGSKVDRWTDKAWYSFSHNADFNNITINKRPPDCDFLHAPLGSKGCEYEKRTSVFGEEQRSAMIQQATTPEEKRSYASLPNSVTMYWEKVEQ